MFSFAQRFLDAEASVLKDSFFECRMPNLSRKQEDCFIGVPSQTQDKPRSDNMLVEPRQA
jgi:hypothetical protein